jgi:Ran GTPase-activating protein (RanGAP) involved in mRNA processing and transport
MHRSVTHLVLRDNGIDDEACRRIANFLKTAGDTSVLSFLSLRDNSIGDTGATSLASALKDPDCALEFLSLRNNRIGNVGLESLGEAVIVGRGDRLKVITNPFDLIALPRRRFVAPIPSLPMLG